MPLRIGYLTTGSSRDMGNWSGLVRHIRDALEDCGHDIYDLDGFVPRIPWATRTRGWRARFLMGKPYGYDRDVRLALSFAALADEKIARLSLDCVVSAQTYPATMLRTSVPVASWCDATFHALMDVYPGYSDISEDSIRQGHYLERRAIQRSCFLAYASEWAAADAIQYYGGDPDKIAVIPFGANCAAGFSSLAEARSAVLAKAASPFRLLFVGRDWNRKGGALAVEVLNELRQQRINAELWVVGCEPFAGAPPPGVKVIGPLNKANASDLAQWRECFAQSDVLFVPTRAECFGVVFAEAAAFALPSVSTRVGGVGDAVVDGVTGFLFAPEEDARPYVEILRRLARNRRFYSQSAVNAFTYYRRTLNWASAGQRFSELLMERLERDVRDRADGGSTAGSRRDSRVRSTTSSLNDFTSLPGAEPRYAIDN
jgi:glycosyltransferase involved in cell wall biosynthesis